MVSSAGSALYGGRGARRHPSPDAVLPPAANAPPPFARFGNVIPLLLGFALIIGGIVLGRRRR